MVRADAGDGSHVRAASEQADRADGFGVRMSFEGVSQLVRVEVEGVGLDVDEHGACADPRDTTCGGEKCVRSGDDDVVGSDVQRHEEDELCVSPRGHPYAVTRSCGLADGPLELLGFLAEHELLGVADFGDLREDLFAERLVLERQVEERHVHPTTVPDSLRVLKGNVLLVGLGDGSGEGQRLGYEYGC